MKINATWRKFANRLLQRSYKQKSLKNIGKWNYLARALLERDSLSTQDGIKALPKWKILLRKLASNPSNDLHLASIKTMKVGEQIHRMEQYLDKR